jgi:mono/diheme cytochrome c family protein
MRTPILGGFATVLALALACGGEAPQPSAPAAPAVPATPAAPPEPPPPAAAGLPADFGTLDDAGKKAALVALGEKVYTTGGSGGVACVTCHQANGEGLAPSFPPLKGQKDAMGDCTKHAGIVVHGLKGEIEIAGVKYNGVMPAQGNLSDEEIAAVITYERSSWGNDFGACLPESVVAARAAPPPTL